MEQYKYKIQVKDNNKTVIFTNNKHSKRANQFRNKYWCVITELNN